jgi:hypothetical protein
VLRTGGSSDDRTPSTFSSVTFNSEQSSEAVDVAADDFWERIVPDDTSVGGAKKGFVTFIFVLFFCCSLGSASALVTFICVLYTLRMQLSR